MKQKFFVKLACLLGMSLGWLWPQTAFSQNQMLMPRFGTHTVTVTQDTVVVDFLDETDFTGYSQQTENSAACVRFKAADPNKRIVLTFEFVDIKPYSTSYPAFIKIYDGAYDDEGYIWPETYSGVTGLLPAGGLDSLAGTYENLTYIAGSEEGLSIGFLYKNANRCSGFKATVSCMENKAVAITEAGSSYHLPERLFGGTRQVNILSYYWVGDGLSVADSITALTFSVEDEAGILSADNFKLYASSDAILSQNPVEATLTSSEGDYTFTLAYPVARGRNVLSVGADLSADAGVMGRSCKVTATGFKTKSHATGYAGFQPAATVPDIEIPHVVLMESGVKTLDISTKTLFYDDGGPDNKITENFEGMVVLRPTTSGRVIQIDFTKIELFNTNPDKDDVLNIYNGALSDIASLDAEKLNIRLLKEKTARVRSMAADGSLTVYLKSTTGVTKAGFEAEISEYEPAAMQFVSADQYRDAGQTGAQGDSLLILGLNIRTDDILAPLTLDAMTLQFTDNRSVSLIAGGTVYYMGKDSVFSAADAMPVGHFSLNGETAVVTMDQPAVVLSEGVNYVYVKVGLTDLVTAGDNVSAYCSSLTLGGAVRSLDNPALSAIGLDNVWYAKDGTKVKAFRDSIGFKPTPYLTYAYESDMSSAQVVTFVPKGKATDNRIVAQIDFSAFDLYAGSSYSNYTNHDVFKVYSGSGTAADNLLWEYKGGADETTKAGPGRILRSQSADGALTVEFQSKAYTGSQCGKGFEAVVGEYIPKPIDIVSAEGFQADSGGVTKGAASCPLLGMAVQVDGTLGNLNWTGAALRWKDNCHTVLTQAKLYITTTAVFDAEAAPVATSTVASGTTTFTGLYALTEGRYWLWVTVDIKETAPNGTRIDAEWGGLNTSLDKDYTIDEPDPIGSLEIRAMYLLQDGQNNDVMVDADGVLMFYDDGGPDGNYSAKKWNGKVTFVPPTGYIIRMEIKELMTGGANHKLAVYGSGDTLLQNRFGEYYKSQYTDKMPSPTDKLQSRTADGKMTVQFTTNNTTTAAGWVIEVRAIQPEPHRITGLQAKAEAADFVGAYSASVPALDITMPVRGDRGTAALKALTFDLTGTTADIRQLAVYYAGTDTLLNPATAETKLFAKADLITVGTTQVTLRGHAVADWEQDYRLFVVYSLGAVDADDKISIALNAAEADGGSVEVRSGTAIHTVKTGVHGDFVVGTSAAADYATLQQAVDAVKGGIDGPVTIRIEDGEYNGTVVIPAIPGLSEQNPLHITSVSGDAEKVTLTAASFVEYSDYASLTRNPNKGVLNVAGAAYVTISDLGFTATNASKFDGLVYIYNGAHHVTLSGIRSVREPSTSYSTAFDHVQIMGASLSGSPIVNCAYVRVADSYFEGGAMACEVSGTGMVGTVKQPSDCKTKQVEIVGNAFVNQGDRPIYIHDVEDLRVVGNTMTTDYVYSSSWYGMDLYRCGAPAEVAGNTVRAELPAGKYAYAIYGRPLYGTVSAPVRIFNNSIQVVHATSSTRGMAFASGSELYGRNAYLDIAHNTVLLSSENPAASSVCFYLDKDALPEAIELTNNLFQNQAGGYVYRMQKADDTAAVAWNHNGTYTSGTAYAYLEGDVTVDEWKNAVASDRNGVVEEATFLNETILGLERLGSFGATKPLDWVTTDIFGSERPATGATMGAYEFENDLEQAPVMAADYPKVDRVTAYTADIKLKMNQSGLMYGCVYEPDESPVVADILAHGRQINAGRMQAVTLSLADLQEHHAYKACFMLKNYNDVQSAVPVCTETFTTEYRPTEPSTFEALDEGMYGEGFEDGTAAFSGFSIVTSGNGDPDAPQGAHRALTTGSAEIRVLNTDEGLNLTGFYYRSKRETAVMAVNASTTFPLTLPASANWRYFGLRGKGLVHTLQIAATDSLWIDDFSGSPLALTVLASYGDTVVDKGETIVLSAAALGGVPDYAYRWTDGAGTEVAQTAEWTLAVEKTSVYMVEVQDAWGGTATARVQVVSKGGDGIADFEGLLATAETNWHGETDGANRFYSGSFRFDNQYDAAYDSWRGYGYANLSGNDYVPALGYGNQYKNAAGGGADGSASYGLVYGTGVATYTGDGDGVRLQGCYVTNNTMLVNSVLEGDSWVGEPFGVGDYFKAVFKGIAADGHTTATMDYYLADYRDENPDEHYVLTTWEWVDLSGLGEIKSLSVSFEGSRSNAYGQTLPAYMAVDNLNAGYRMDERLYAVQAGMERELTFDGVFGLEGRGQWQVEPLEASVDEAVATVAVTETGLRVSAFTAGETAALLKARRNGRTAYVRLCITVTEEPAQVDKPVFNPAGGEVEAGTEIRLICAPAGAVIRYTTDGSTPDETSAIYTNPLVIDEAVTVKAFATLAGMSPSEVAEASYTIKDIEPTPDASLRSLTVDKGELTPAFSPEVYRYTVQVADTVEFLTVTAVANDVAATVTGDGPKTLNFGANSFAVTVTAADGETAKTYRLVVTRTPGTPHDSTANETLDATLLTSAYPNPTTGLLHVEVAEPAVLELLTTDGRHLLRKEVGAGTVTLTLERSGLYILRITAGDRVSVRRIVKR